jgi:predicted DNA-binding WGR domain protein
VNQRADFDSEKSLALSMLMLDSCGMDSPVALSGYRYLAFEAIDVNRNMARRYEVEVLRDLFGSIIVEYRWGRIASRGQQRGRSFDHEDAAQHFVGQLVSRRRRSARSGVPYRLVEQG